MSCLAGLGSQRFAAFVWSRLGDARRVAASTVMDGAAGCICNALRRYHVRTADGTKKHFFLNSG